MAVWVVRAGKRGEEEPIALENNLVTIHWNELSDLSKVKSKDELTKLYRAANPEENRPAAIRAGVGQVWAFLTEIEKGDLAIIPLHARTRRDFVAVGEVTGPYTYRFDLGEEVRHTLPVKWLGTDLLRTTLDQELLDTLRRPPTVYQIKGRNAEERFRAALRGESNGTKDACEGDTEEVEQSDPAQASRDELLKFIQRKFARHRLADLVDAVLKAEGYMTKVSQPGPDGGVDILAGSGPMGFAEPRLCVQVKSGSSRADVTVLRGLQGIFKNFGANQGLLVSWGGFTTAVLQEARQSFFSIRLWGAHDLLEAIFKNYEKFPDELRTELPLKRIWALAAEE